MAFASSQSHVAPLRSKASAKGCKHNRHVLARVAAKGQQAVLDKPAWTGDSWPSKLANALINTPILFSAMKVLAYNVMKSTGNKRGVPWDENIATLTARLPELEAIKAQLERPVTYPSYYLMPFHAYDEGNLSWKAAFDVEPVTSVMALRTFKSETTLLPEEALGKLRKGIADRLTEFMAQHHIPAFGPGQSIVDIGCSVGVSTRALEQQFPQVEVSGLDLSPYFLAVAEERERRKPAGQRRIRYSHALAEDTGLPPASVDLVSLQFIFHECPEPAIKDIMRESARIVKPGGVLMMVDNNPKSATIQNLPPALATLMKSTEPHSDSYYATDMEACMQAAGFQHVVTLEADHRHRVVLGQAP